MATPVVLSFSGGKDSVLALERLRAEGWDVRALLAAFVEDDGTLVMHGVPERLVALQAASLGVPLVPLPRPARAAEQRVRGAARGGPRTLPRARRAPRRVRRPLPRGHQVLPRRPHGAPRVRAGVSALARGHACAGEAVRRRGLSRRRDLRRHRQARRRSGQAASWTRASSPGLPPGVDPCGENGEFHTFVYDGPGFFYPVRFERAAGPMRGKFAYARLRPLSGEACARCGATFECGMKAGVEHCWCADLPPIAPSTAFTSCLCPRCLRDEIATRAPIRSAGLSAWTVPPRRP